MGRWFSGVVSRWRRWLLGAAVAVLASLLSGCGAISDYLPPVTVSPVMQSPVPSAAPAAPDPGGTPATVFKVVDGDTIRIDDGKTTVRILGIDTPETKDPRKPVQCWGPEASAWAAEQLSVGSEVRLLPDPTQDEVDRYGRVLAYVAFQRDGAWLDYSVEAARTGNARVYVYDSKVQKYAEIAAAQAEAIEKRIGLWTCP